MSYQIIWQALALAGVTMLPFLELRASIPLGILSGSVKLPLGLYASGFGMPWPIVFLVCVISNIILGVLIYVFFKKIINFFTRFRWFRGFYNFFFTRTQKKAHYYVDKYGEIGMAIFIGMPLPGSGVYSGALGAHILGFGFKRFFIAMVIGVLIAGVIVTLLSTGALRLTG